MKKYLILFLLCLMPFIYGMDAGDTVFKGVLESPAVQGITAIKVGYVQRDTSTASGTQSVTGVGFQPKAVILFSVQDGSHEISFGLDDGSNHYCIFYVLPTYDDWNVATSVSIYAYETGANTYVGSVTSMDSDGFTINWSKSGSTTGTVTVLYLAIR